MHGRKVMGEDKTECKEGRVRNDMYVQAEMHDDKLVSLYIYVYK